MPFRKQTIQSLWENQMDEACQRPHHNVETQTTSLFDFRRSLEAELQPELDIPRAGAGGGATDVPRAPAADDGIRSPKLSKIERIEELRSEL